MTRLILIRHGPTDWNAQGRIQGWSDPPLSAAGRAQVETWRLPADLTVARWLVSPLRRARETAAVLGVTDPEMEPTLKEMSWGRWEGERLADLRQRLGAEMQEMERRGLDFRPPGGESPRDVQQRLRALLMRLARDRVTAAAITHKGVIRATYALAAGWDMVEKPAVKLGNGYAQEFLLDDEGRPRPGRLNQRLQP